MDSVDDLKQSLKCTKALARRLFDAHPHPAIIYSLPDFIIRDVNPAATQAYGETASELIGSSITALVDEVHREEFSTFLRQLTTTPISPAKRFQHSTKSKGSFPVRIQLHPFNVDFPFHIPFTEKCLTQLLIVEDLSEQQRLEERLEIVKTMHTRIFENAVEGIFQSTPSGMFLTVNPAFAKMLGYDSPRQMTTEIHSIKEQLYVDKTLRAKFINELNDYTIAFNQEFEAYKRNGDHIWLSCNVRAVRDDHQRILFYEGFAKDITESKRNEQRLKSLAIELNRSNFELNQFASIISHDLKEPIRTVATYVSLLNKYLAGSLDKDTTQYMSYISDGARRMNELIDGLLVFCQANRNLEPENPVPISLVLRDVLNNLATLISQNEALIIYNDELPSVAVDRTQLTLLFQNLIQNAIKFRKSTAPRINIRVSAIYQEAWWEFSIEDNGLGIEAKFAERIFSMFQRLNPRGKYPGIGLGLATCKRLVEAYGGKIWVESIPSVGSTFKFTLPRTPL